MSFWILWLSPTLDWRLRNRGTLYLSATDLRPLDSASEAAKMPYANATITSDHLFKLLDRLDQQIHLLNIKASLILPFDIFLLSLAVNFCEDEGVAVSTVPIFDTFFRFAALLLIFISTLFASRTILSFLKPGKDDSTRSMLFFGSISQMQLEQFRESLGKFSEKDLTRDLANQIHILSTTLTKRFLYFNISLITALAGFLMIVVLSACSLP